MQYLQVVGVHPRSESLEAENHGDRHPDFRCASIIVPVPVILVPMILVRLPLGDVELVFGEVGVAEHLQTHIVEALQGADTRGADGNGLSLVTDQFGDGLTAHTDILGMHLMTLDFLALHGLKRACADVQRQFLTVDAVGINRLKHLRCEMQTGCRCRHTALNLRIDRLVGGLVALLRRTVQIRRNGQFTHGVDDLSETHRGIPREVDAVGGAVDLSTCRLNS